MTKFQNETNDLLLKEFRTLSTKAHQLLKENISNFDWVARLINKFENTEKTTQLDLFNFMNKLEEVIKLNSIGEIKAVKLRVPELLLINFEIFFQLFLFIEDNLSS